MTLISDTHERLDRFLARHLPTHSRTKLSKLVSEGAVLVDGTAQRPSFQLGPGMSITLAEPGETAPHDLTPADIPLDVRYEDEDMLIVNKPRGLAVHPAISLKEPSLVNALLSRNHDLSQAGGSFRPGIVHRLDKDTTGLLVVAKNDQAHALLAKEIESKEAERRYVAVAAGDIDRDRFVIDAPVARDRKDRIKMSVDPLGKHAVTHVKRLARLEQGSLLALRLETGRTHQIRVHLRAIGHPVLGDRMYAPKELAECPLQLHAVLLAVTQPRTGERIVVFCPPPSDFFGRDLVTEEVVEDF